MQGQTVRWETLVPAHIRSIQAYIPSKPDDVLRDMFHCPSIHRLNNNENALGPAKEAQAAIAAFDPAAAAIYPSGDAFHLRQRLAQKFGLDADCFLVGNGANEVIAFVINAFCQAGDNIITADKTFAVYEWVAEFSGYQSKQVPLCEEAFDAQSMLKAIDERTKILFVCNPNNPTGTYWPEKKLRAFLEAVGGRQIVVLDEAYAEFVEQEDFPDGMKLLHAYPNLVVFRTFSKMYGLAGLRIGYLAGSPEVVNVIRRTCVVYSVNALAQVAALATLDNEGDHVANTRTLVREAKAFLHSELTALGLHHLAGEGNYMMIRLPLSDTLAYRKLMQHGFMVRTMTGFRYPNHIRLTMDKLPVMEGFIKALKAIL